MQAARVWVVDDDRSVRFVLATALREAGYAVDAFENARDALAALRTRGAPDLLFTDVRMPGDDGLVLLESSRPPHPQLPVIVMSAYTDIASTAGAFRGGAHDSCPSPSISTTRWRWPRARCRQRAAGTRGSDGRDDADCDADRS